MPEVSFQEYYESLFAGNDPVFNEKLLHQSSCNKVLNLVPISDLSWRRFFFAEIGLETVLIHGITSFLSHSSHDSLSKPSRREIRSAKWVTCLAERLIFLQSKGEFDGGKLMKSTFDSIKAAHNLIQILVHEKIIEVVFERNDVFNLLFDSGDKLNDQKRYQLNNELQSFISNYDFNGIRLGKIQSPLSSPMFEVPRNHQHENGILCGGHLNPLFHHSISDRMLSDVLVNEEKTPGNNKISNIDFSRISTLKIEENSKVLTSINQLQQVKWSYNDKMIQLLQKFERPENPEKADLMNFLHQEITLARTNNHRQILATQNISAFYYPWFFDYRGRVYCSRVVLNPQGDDLSRSLLMFHTFQTVKNDNILYDYVRGRLNIEDNITTAKLKSSIIIFSEFLSEVINNSEQIKYSSLESQFSFFLEELGIENQSPIFIGERFTILALVLEFQHYWSNNREWRIPIHLDAKCNGQQHISAIMKNTKIAELTNLFDSERQTDLYEYIAEKVWNNLSKSSEINQTERERVMKYISRKYMKIPVMIAGYGAKKDTIYKKLLEDDTFVPLSNWNNEECSRKEKVKQRKNYNLLPSKPTKNQLKDKYFFVPNWAVKSLEHRFKEYKKHGFYSVTSYNPAVGSVFESILKPNNTDIEKHFNTSVLNYKDCIIAQESQIVEEIKYIKRKKIIKLIVEEFEKVSLNLLLLSDIKDNLVRLYDAYIKNNNQNLSESGKWFSFTSKMIGMTVSFVRLKKAKKQNGTELVKLGIHKFTSNRVLGESMKKKYVNIKLFGYEIARPYVIKPKILPSFIHSLDASHLHLIVDQWYSNNPGIGPIVTIHDSFGMHPNDVAKFREISRNTFIQLHKENPLVSFFEQCGIEAPNLPPTEGFDIEKVDSGMFTF